MYLIPLFVGCGSMLSWPVRESFSPVSLLTCGVLRSFLRFIVILPNLGVGSSQTEQRPVGHVLLSKTSGRKLHLKLLLPCPLAMAMSFTLLQVVGQRLRGCFTPSLCSLCSTMKWRQPADRSRPAWNRPWVTAVGIIFGGGCSMESTWPWTNWSWPSCRSASWRSCWKLCRAALWGRSTHSW